MNLSELREEYTRAGLDREDLAGDPFEQFEKWLRQACTAEILEPNAMVVATVDASGQPFNRTVLLKQFDARGLVFFTNFESRKGRHLDHNPRISALFPWIALERQAMINGHAERISASDAFKYFASRPLGSRLGAWSSPQSKVISNRSILESKLAQVREKFKNGEVSLPSFWGGFRILPHTFEFWQGRPNRLHDRFIYEKQPDQSWSLNRLAP